MSDWNPRPMYASQPTIDPQDDRRIYMLNSYSYSDNGGETFTSPRTTTHGDDRFVWVNPRDSRHVIKLDDGGVGISFDRGLKFLYVGSLPVSQYYRVAVDNAVPYNVYGGLQDNGCWRGPSASWTSAGILNDHWERLCGGDGFTAVPDPARPASRLLDVAVPRAGAQRHAHVAEPGHPPRRSHRRHRRPPQLEHLGQAACPRRCWATPCIPPTGMRPSSSRRTIRPRSTSARKHLFRSRDRGTTWEDLGDMTTGVDRATLPLMGRMPDETVLSIDDGVPVLPGHRRRSPSRRGGAG